MEIRHILARLKTENGLTTEQLSRRSGVPKGTLNKLLNGETANPRGDTLRKIAGALGYPVEVFYSARRMNSPCTACATPGTSCPCATTTCR
ncbi:MAG: helix-turn-helix transcriptional regulator [Clostridia bacterium]|nr:helix-turn-helix transcriptional regulator [Clostridia bacterium]